ncbi:YqgE/AlgH family protein [Sphingobacterium sp. SGG-5]|uniref:YqgE/AlgH family protein n=1 Tax=Sphingobacterium sp. SGG-5 TaxID=2710881 RepID=UPI0013E9BD6E|nr:YqgE/AlgH family protein [Sphingobacterium sp. SGG-5]NGM61997.1 YqgE/AlgH family protein [Sphingobacterium sp. SGG-5]
MFNSNTPVQGSLLVSEPFMLDPNFERSVVMLCEHNEDGTVGLVLNHQSTLLLSDLSDDIQNEKFKLYFGGPVQSNALFFLHRAYDRLLSGTKVYQDVYWGGDFERLVFLINEDLIQPEEIKFFLGYSGWSTGQLNDEIDQNNWAVHRDYDQFLIFLNDGEDLWKRTLINLGPKYAHVANFPKSPNLN